MATLNRNYSLNIVKPESSFEKDFEWGDDLMRSNKVKPMRENVDAAKNQMR